MTRRMLAVCLAIGLLTGAGGCARLKDMLPGPSRARAFPQTLPDIGGWTVLAHRTNGTYIVTSGGVATVSPRGLEPVGPLPEGYAPVPSGAAGEYVLLVGESGRTLALWDPGSESDPVIVPIRGAFDSVFAADLDGDGTLELITVANTPFADTGTPVGSDERVEIWSITGAGAKLLWQSASEGDGITSLVTGLRLVSWGNGVALSWIQTRGTKVANLEDRTLVCVLAEEASVRDVEYQLDTVHEPQAPMFSTSLMFRMPFTGTHYLEVTRTAEVAPRLVLDHLGTGESIDIDTGAIEPVDATFADIDGDGDDDIVIAGRGDPLICNDTSTGYVGWARARDDETFGPVEWSDPLGGGPATVHVEDVDGVPGAEIVAGVVETFCNPVPRGLFVWSFAAR